jgi:hypothetical protein
MDFLNLGIEQMKLSAGMICFLVLALIWSAIWKALALWKAARKNSPVWFIVLLLVNTIGILEILYVLVFSNLKVEKTKSRRKKKRR